MEFLVRLAMFVTKSGCYASEPPIQLNYLDRLHERGIGFHSLVE
jgi:hypothetical protein